ncbi:MAG: hypothetical protein PHY92_10705 [Alphaproteobacteria bacterium]|nr:hypothetical protein [Alphaproteobacteria bacterium]
MNGTRQERKFTSFRMPLKGGEDFKVEVLADLPLSQIREENSPGLNRREFFVFVAQDIPLESMHSIKEEIVARGRSLGYEGPDRQFEMFLGNLCLANGLHLSHYAPQRAIAIARPSGMSPFPMPGLV